MIESFCVFVSCMAGIYLTVLGTAALAAPGKAERFLLGFAATQTLHLAELLARVAVGAAFVVASPRLPPAQLFTLFGWILLGTSALLLLVPWRWHRHFAARAVPAANRHIGLVGAAASAGGVFILVSVFRGMAG